MKLDAGTIVVKTAYGDMPVKWSAVVTIITGRPLVVTVTGTPGRLATLVAAGGGRAAIRDGAVTVADVALADIVAIAPPTPPLVFTGGASAGLLWTGGNTGVSSLHLDGQAVARRPADRYTFEATVNRATDRGSETARNASGSARYDRFLTERVFLNANAIFANDKFRDLTVRTAVGAGVGYQGWQTPRGQLSVDGGFGYVNQDFDTAPDASYAAVREAVKLDLVLAPGLAAFFHQQDAYIGITGDDQLFFRMQNGVRIAMAARIVAAAQFAVDYDRSPAPGRKSTDRSSAITVGYKFSRSLARCRHVECHEYEGRFRSSAISAWIFSGAGYGLSARNRSRSAARCPAAARRATSTRAANRRCAPATTTSSAAIGCWPSAGKAFRKAAVT